MSAENNSDCRPQKKDEFRKKTPEDMLADKIVMHYGYFEEHSLKNVAKRCVKLMISEHYKNLCYDNFKFPSYQEMKELVLEEMKQNFDDKVMPIIEQNYPDLNDNELDAEVSRIEKIYEKEHEEQLESTTKAALKELKITIRGLQKELKALKRKYTI